MRYQRAFYLNRGYLYIPHLQHVIASAVVIIVAFAVAVIPVPCVKPFPQHRGFGLIVLAVVESSHRFALDLKITDFTVGYFNTVIIDNFSNVSRHDFTGASRLNISGTVGDKNMHQLGRPDAVQYFQSKPFFPLIKDFFRQCLQRRYAQPQ